MKFTLHLPAVNGGPFSCRPAEAIEVEAKDILANDVSLEVRDGKPVLGSTKLYVIGHEFGAIAALWARHDQDAMDELVDQDLGDCFLISKEDQESASDDERQEWSHLGNAGEPCNLDHAWIREVSFEGPRDWHLIAALCEARGAGHSTLDF